MEEEKNTASEQTAQPTTSQTGKKSKTWLWIVIAVVVIVLIILIYYLATYASRKASDAVAESYLSGVTGQDVDIDSSSGTTKVTTDQGTTEVSESSEWPSTMPSSVPKFTYGTIEGSSSTTVDGGDAWSVSFTDLDSNAAASYRSALEAAGWTQVSTYSSGDMDSDTWEYGEYIMNMSVDNTDSTANILVGTTGMVAQ